MAKKTISRLSVLAVLIVFLAACSKTSEYTNVIPADASVVASINLKSLASKAGLDDKENEAAKQKVLEALKSGMNAATFQQLEKVMKNPGESGIDVESPFYVFSSSSFPYPTVVGKVNNEDKLHASLDVMAKGNIVGFSNRLNTILVPQSFMKWANENFAPNAEAQPARLIIEVSNPADSAIASYFQKKGYETEDGKLDAGKTTYFLRLIVGIVLGVGLFISILSFYILMLSIFLLLQKNTTKLESLLLIGYSPNKVALPYQLLTVGLNVIVLVLSIGLVSWLRSYYIDSIRILFPQLETGSLWAAISMGILLFIVVSVINILAVKKKVLSIWMHKS